MPATEAGKDRTKDPGLRPVKRLTGFFLAHSGIRKNIV